MIALVVCIFGCSGAPMANGGLSNHEKNSLKNITDSLDLIQKHYVDEVDMDVLTEGCIAGMLSRLDDRAGFYTSDNLDTKSRLGSLGISIRLKDGIPTVVRATPGSAAYKKGIRRGDILTAVDFKTVIGRPYTDIAQRLMGNIGTKAHLSIVHAGETTVKNYTLERVALEPSGVEAKVIGTDIGYLRISHFDQRTVRESVSAINAFFLKPETSFKGLIVDLRDNPGGILYSAIGFAGIFLEPSLLIASMDGRTKSGKRDLYAEEYREMDRGSDVLADVDPELKKIKLVVLVNQGTASGAEIVAGALKDHGRATVIGEKTNGIGTIQSIYWLNEGLAIRFTTSRYLTPNGHQLESKGIAPHIRLDSTKQHPESEDLFISCAVKAINEN